jgi:hypothetical protein
MYNVLHRSMNKPPSISHDKFSLESQVKPLRVGVDAEFLCVQNDRLAIGA